MKQFLHNPIPNFVYLESFSNVDSITSQERHTSAPYLRLKNSKKTSKWQVFFSKVTEKSEAGPNWRAKRGPFEHFQHPFCSKIFEKNERGPLETLKIFRKKVCAKKVERVPLVSSGIVCYAKKRTTIIVQFPGPNGTIWSL